MFDILKFLGLKNLWAAKAEPSAPAATPPSPPPPQNNTLWWKGLPFSVVTPEMVRDEHQSTLDSMLANADEKFSADGDVPLDIARSHFKKLQSLKNGNKEVEAISVQAVRIVIDKYLSKANDSYSALDETGQKDAEEMNQEVETVLHDAHLSLAKSAYNNYKAGYGRVVMTHGATIQKNYILEHLVCAREPLSALDPSGKCTDADISKTLLSVKTAADAKLIPAF